MQKDLKEIIMENYQDFMKIIEHYNPETFKLIEQDNNNNKFYIFPQNETQFKNEAYQDGNIIVKVFHPDGEEELIYRKITKIWNSSVSWNINSMKSITHNMEQLNYGSNLTAYACPERYKQLLDKVSGSILSKDDIKEICQKNGINITNYYTKASKNTKAEIYWANPYIRYLQQDWFLILDDYKKKVLHCFKIPAFSINETKIKRRTDIPDKAELKIKYDDKTFTDLMSGLKFSKYLIKSIKY